MTSKRSVLPVALNNGLWRADRGTTSRCCIVSVILTVYRLIATRHLLARHEDIDWFLLPTGGASRLPGSLFSIY